MTEGVGKESLDERESDSDQASKPEAGEREKGRTKDRERLRERKREG